MVQITLKDVHGVPLPAPFSGIVDSGADASTFKLNMLGPLGIDFADCEECKGQGMGGELKAQFCESPFILLGCEDFFKAFDVTFRQQTRTFVLDEL